MSDFVESLRRLYLDRRLKEATLNALWHKAKSAAMSLTTLWAERRRAMYTILINEDNTLTASVVERVMQQSKLVDTLHFWLTRNIRAKTCATMW